MRNILGAPPTSKLTTASYERSVRRTAKAMLNRRTAGFLGIEKKFYDTSLAATAITAPTDASGGEMDPSATSMISTPAVGTSEQNREGKRIVIKSLVIKGNVVIPPGVDKTAMAGAVSCFLAVVLDTQSNAAQMNSEDCFKNTSAAAVQATNPVRNLLFGNRFKILKSETFNFEVPNATWDGTNIEVGGARKDFDWYIPLKNLAVNFNAGTTASIASVVDNSIHVIAYVNSTSTAPTLAYNARIRFLG